MELLLTFIFIALYRLSHAGNIPDYIHICNRNDVNVEKCVRESLEILRPKLRDGIEELGVPRLEPLRVDEIVIFRWDDSSSSMSLKNVDVTGVSDLQFTKLKLDNDKNIFHIGSEIPVVELNGDYDYDGVGWKAPTIKRTGKFQANATMIESDGVFLAKIIENKGRKQITFTNLNLTVNFNDYYVHLDNHSDDEGFAQFANKVLNSDKDQQIPSAIPIIQMKAAEVILEIVNKIAQSVDYDEIFPDN